MDLRTTALLVNLTLKSFAPKRTDKRLSQKLELDNHSASGTLRAVKTLLPEEAVSPIAALQSSVRAYHYKMTLPYNDEGQRILPSASFADYTAEIRLASQEQDRLVGTFVTNYEQYVAAARVALNGAFRQDDYPPADRVARKFELRTVFTALPESTPLTQALGLDQHIAESTESAVRGAIADLWRRIAEPVAKMAERLADDDAVFRDSLVGNIRTITSLIPTLNITGDPHLETMRRRLETELSRFEPDQLRNNPFIRKDVATKANEILNAMSPFMAPAE
jgi:hypothetical protein